MVISEQKPFEEILEMLEDVKKVMIAGCTDCATRCGVGGEPEVAEMKVKLEEAGKEVTGAIVILGSCTIPSVKKTYIDNRAAVNSADAILTLSCGNGAQAVRETMRKTIYPGTNTIFTGWEAPFREFEQKCRQCGDCKLGWTDGICPFTVCTKGLANGPCGGSQDGKCEVDPERDCGWTLIYERLKEVGKLDNMRKIWAPRDYGKTTTPQKITVPIR